MAHIGRQELLDRLQAIDDVIVGGRYQHYKTKGIYVVEKLVILEATDQIAVAYHDEVFPQITWIREYSDFVAKIDEQTRRFSLLSYP